MVCGTWGGGTSTVAGLLHHLGLQTDGDYFMTNDVRTQNSFESIKFRELIQQILSEETLDYIIDKESAVPMLEKYRDNILCSDLYQNNPQRPLFLKYPLASLLMVEIAEVFDVQFIYVVRKLKDIERTNERRRWSKSLGLHAAQKIYSYMFSTLINFDMRILLIRYDDLVNTPLHYVSQIVSLAELELNEAELLNKSKLIKRL